jgi:MoaA/NifB/PqqE/SkfB family radical SAM enzyme
MFYDIEMTNKCNLRCKTCPNQFKYRKQGYMTPETLKLIADELANGVPLNERIVLHGLGEPHARR